VDFVIRYIKRGDIIVLRSNSEWEDENWREIEVECMKVV
jgi:hypothetical protein